MRKVLYLFVLVIFSIVLSACSAGKDNPAPSSPSEYEQEISSPTEENNGLQDYPEQSFEGNSQQDKADEKQPISKKIG